MGAAADLASAVAVLRQVSPRLRTCTDEELVADVEAVEALGRMIDGLRPQVAAQVEHRSRKVLGEQSLAFRLDARDGVQLVEHLTRTSHRTARSRVGLGAALAPTVSLLGDALPGRYIRTAPGGDDAVEETDPEYREEEAPDGGERRPRAQQDYDTLFETLVAGIRAEADGIQSHAVTHEIVVTITADKVEARHGQGPSQASWRASRFRRSNAPPAPLRSGCS